MVIFDGSGKVGVELAKTGVSSAAYKSVRVERRLHILGAVAEETGKLYVLVADFSNLLKRPEQILLGEVADAVHLKSVFHDFVSLKNNDFF